MTKHKSHQGHPNPFKRTDRNTEMQRLRASGASLQGIADIYGISRERVRQLVGNTGYLVARTQRRNLENLSGSDLEKLTRDEAMQKYKKSCGWGIAQKLGNIHHVNNGLGNKAEELVNQKLIDVGISNRMMGFKKSYDIQLDNGLRIDVKSAKIPQKSPSQRDISPVYNIHNIKQGQDCDFFIIVLPAGFDDPTPQFFIVPSSHFYHTQSIKVTYPGTKRKVWIEEYHNRFDLLNYT